MKEPLHYNELTNHIFQCLGVEVAHVIKKYVTDKNQPLCQDCVERAMVLSAMMTYTQAMSDDDASKAIFDLFIMSRVCLKEDAFSIVSV